MEVFDVFSYDRSHALSQSRDQNIGVMNLLSLHGASQPGFQLARHRPLPVEEPSRWCWPRSVTLTQNALRADLADWIPSVSSATRKLATNGVVGKPTRPRGPIDVDISPSREW